MSAQFATLPVTPFNAPSLHQTINHILTCSVKLKELRLSTTSASGAYLPGLTQSIWLVMGLSDLTAECK